MYKNIKHSCTFANLRHLCVRDSLLCVFICSKISINSIGWLGHLIGSLNCDVTGPLWRHQNAVSCLGWDKSISDTRRLSRTPRCTRQDGLTNRLIFNMGIPIPGKDGLYIEMGPCFRSLLMLWLLLVRWIFFSVVPLLHLSTQLLGIFQKQL